MMNFRQAERSFNRINWDNKTDKQATKLLKERMSKLGLDLPKYMQKETMSKKQINQGIKRLGKEYQKAIEKDKKLASQFMDLKRQYNKQVNKLNNRSLSGRTNLEKEYLKGEMIIIPTISSIGFQANKLTFKEIGNVEFKTLKAKQQYINMKKDNLKVLKNTKHLTDDKFYNIKSNKKEFNEIMEGYHLDENEIKLLNSLYNNLTEFEREIIVKHALQQIKDKYPLKDEERGEEEYIPSYKIFNAIYGKMKGLVKDNRNIKMSVNVKGDVFMDK